MYFISAVILKEKLNAYYSNSHYKIVRRITKKMQFTNILHLHHDLKESRSGRDASTKLTHIHQSNPRREIFKNVKNLSLLFRGRLLGWLVTSCI